MIPLYDTKDSSNVTAVPSHVKVEKIYLFSSLDVKTAATYGKDIDQSLGYSIEQVTEKLTFVESLYSLAVTGTIKIVDRLKFFQDARIHGQELLKMSFKRWNPETQTYDKDFTRDFYVTEITDFVREEFVATYTLHFVSPHALPDKFKRISRAYGYTDTTGGGSNDVSGSSDMLQAWKDKYSTFSIIYNPPNTLVGESTEGTSAEILPLEYPEQFIYHIITEELLYPKTAIFLSADKSHKRMKVVVPNWRPFRTIQWLLRNTFSENGFPWYCFETFWGGIQIVPYYVLMKDYVIEKPYIFNKHFTPSPDSVDYFEAIHKKIWKMDVAISSDTYNKIGNGTYSSFEWYIDIATKFTIPNENMTVEDTHLKYEDTVDDKAWLIDQFAPFTKNVEKYVDPIHAPNLQESNYTYFVPYNSSLHGTTEESFPYNVAFSFENTMSGTTYSSADDAIEQTDAPTDDKTTDPVEVDPNSPCKASMNNSSNYFKNDPEWLGYLSGLEKKYGLSSGLLYGTMMTESSGNPHNLTERAKDTGKAVGLFQFTSEGRADVGITREQANNPCIAADAAARELLVKKKYLKGKGTEDNMIRAYNAGQGGIGLAKADVYLRKVRKYQAQAPYRDGKIPPSTIPEDTGVSTFTGRSESGEMTTVYSANVDPKDVGKVGRTGEMLKKGINHLSHKIKIMGDFEIRPGTVITINLQKTTDHSIELEGDRDNPQDITDKFFSGAYLTAETEHVFDSDGFYSNCIIIRPSSPLDLG